MLVRHVENVSAYALQKRFREIGKVVLDGKRKGVFNAPERAIEYGRISEKKGRYHHPDYP